MKVICAYCGRLIRQEDPASDTRVSHGMCPECDQHYSRLWNGASAAESVDDCSAPALLVDPDGRVLATNERVAELLGLADGDDGVTLGEQAMGRVDSHFPEGCGETRHCRGSGLQRIVRHTAETGEALERVPAWLDRQEGPVALVVSSCKRGTVVQVLIERTNAPVPRR